MLIVSGFAFLRPFRCDQYLKMLKRLLQLLQFLGDTGTVTDKFLSKDILIFNMTKHAVHQLTRFSWGTECTMVSVVRSICRDRMQVHTIQCARMWWHRRGQQSHYKKSGAPAKKLKVYLTLPQEGDQTTTIYSWREPSTIPIFCCQAWIGADYENRALFFLMSSRDRVAMATLVLDLRIHPFVVPMTIFLDVTHRGLVLALWHVRESEDIPVLGSILWLHQLTLRWQLHNLHV